MLRVTQYERPDGLHTEHHITKVSTTSTAANNSAPDETLA